ncbi:hypothetical protein [Escherichia phage ZCEC12]|nr:hypothetical protein P9622_gp25 [Escherichia phage ZCEC10]UJQ87866.1 hypothetical protein [Escherichia phage ZCEC11]UJQ87956.1 hypothetical protein [Escherichia phage ZCEC12]UJQ88011.1 hypothetical protein [Escherichia phage ZCEC10]
MFNFRPCFDQLLIGIVHIQHAGNSKFERVILSSQIAAGLVVTV